MISPLVMNLGGGSSGDPSFINPVTPLVTLTPVDPIYDDKCEVSPAYCVVDFFLKNGVTHVTLENLSLAENLISKWTSAPAGFNKTHFINQMHYSVTYIEGRFQCVGFAAAVNVSLASTSDWGGTDSGWQGAIQNGLPPQCPIIKRAGEGGTGGAGAGDMILWPVDGWYHIAVLSQYRSDGSFTISQANWGGPGVLSNVAGNNLENYLSNKTVLRCN